MDDPRAYELGVADVIAHIVGADATVEHDVRIRGRTGRMRQVDIAVRGRAFGLPDEALIVVDCKLHARPVNVHNVDAFRGLVEDIGADLGLLVSASGFTETADVRAGHISMRVHVLTRDELAQWVPPGTRFITFGVPVDERTNAWRALIKVGYRVRESGFPPAEPETHPREAQVEAYRLADIADASEFHNGAVNALETAGIDARVVSSSVVMQGGTPGHMWIPIYFDGWASPIRVMAVDELELAEAVERVADALRIPVSALDVRRPPGWPRPPLTM